MSAMTLAVRNSDTNSSPPIRFKNQKEPLYLIYTIMSNKFIEDSRIHTSNDKFGFSALSYLHIYCQDNLSWFKANTLSVLLQVWPPPSRSVLSGLISGPQRLCWEPCLPAHCQSNCSECSRIPGERWCEIQIWYVLLTKLQKSPCTHAAWALRAWSASLTRYKLQQVRKKKKKRLVGVRSGIERPVFGHFEINGIVRKLWHACI